MRVPFVTLGLAEDRAAVDAAIRPGVDEWWYVLDPDLTAHR